MQSILFQFQHSETDLLPMLKPLLAGRCNLYLSNRPPITVFEVAVAAKQKGCTAVATTDPNLVWLLLSQPKQFSMDSYAGTVLDSHGLEWLILPQLLTAKGNVYFHAVPEGRFLYERYFKKILSPSSWLQIPNFCWSLFEPKNTEALLEVYSRCFFIACDIETLKEGRLISCISFSGVEFDNQSKSFRITTTVVPFTEVYNIAFTRTILRLSVAKGFQNGKYDIAYLLRYNCTPTNYVFDTINMFHSWYCELPKDLAAIAAFCLRKWPYWKHLAKTGDLQVYYEYNARDSFATAMIILSMLVEVPEYFWTNYYKEFPVVFPCILAETTGMKASVPRLLLLKKQMEETSKKWLTSLQVMVNNPQFNPGSWQQTQKLFAILGSEDIKGTGAIPRDKVSARHPLNKRLLKAIENYRKDVKLLGTYLDEKKVWHGRIYYSLNPHGTDTGRLASTDSQFSWGESDPIGLQIQNIPRDRRDIQIKSFFVADEGFHYGECDYSQNEARGTAYLSGDTALIAAVDDPSMDYHGRNAASFFGLDYTKIVRSTFDELLVEWVHETVDKIIRDLAKRTNHGVNYNMTAGVLLDTMGIENVIQAKRLLLLPQHLTLKQVCQYLLDRFDATYPIVRSDYYKSIIAEVSSSKQMIGPTGWTRHCFMNPAKDKRAMNAYAAHKSQSLAAMILNQAYIKVYRNVWMANRDNFKLNPQIHDSIVFQYRIGHEHLAFLVKEQMAISTSINDTFGIVRNLVVPVDLKGGSNIWSELKPMKRLTAKFAA